MHEFLMYKHNFKGLGVCTMRTVFATLEKCIPWVSKTMRKRKHTTKMCINVLQTIDFHTSKQGPEPNKVGIHWFPTLFR